jgi:hypothetical protein
MPRRRRDDWNQKKYEQYLKEGRGQGTGKNYIPWIKVQNFPSEAGTKRTPGWKTGRLHHCLSEPEKKVQKLLDWNDTVIDIREQFPLLDLDLALHIATHLGIGYPKERKSGFPYILTTDFMVTLRENGRESNIALQVKPSAKLKNKRVLEKFQLERLYYAEQGIEWGIMTEKHIPPIRIKNINYVYGDYWLEATAQKTVEELREIGSILKCRLQKNELKINQVTSNLDKELNLHSGTSLYIFKHLVARKEIILDMDNTKIYKDPSSQAILKIISDTE